MRSLIILGRQPALGLAELESLYGNSLRAVGDTAVLLDIPTDAIDFNRLGGAVKLAKVLTILDKTGWRDIESYLLKSSPEHAGYLPEGKLQLGLSSYGFNVTPQQLTATGLSMKKAIRKTGRSVRLSPNTEQALSSAQVFHNKLTGPNGWELLLVRDSDKTIIAQTIAVQDIDAYTLRDRSRPKRDARVGMLPPKLAQTIVNLAVSQLATLDNKHALTVLDPFCGTGVLLQEALLMGYRASGTDLEPRMIDYSEVNLQWLISEIGLRNTEYDLEQGDATNHRWQPPIDAVACETYLGKPFTTTPDSATLAKTISEVDLILKKFLHNIHDQLTVGTRLCIAVPAWQVRPGQFRHLPLVDSLGQIGYNRIRFEQVRDDQLLYYREDQIVARQLLVITRK